MTNLEFAMSSRRQVLEQSNALYKNSLKNSHGTPEMSPEDTKMAVIALHGIIEQQQILIGELANAVSDLQNKKPFWKKIFKK